MDSFGDRIDQGFAFFLVGKQYFYSIGEIIDYQTLVLRKSNFTNHKKLVYMQMKKCLPTNLLGIM